MPTNLTNQQGIIARISGGNIVTRYTSRPTEALHNRVTRASAPFFYRHSTNSYLGSFFSFRYCYFTRSHFTDSNLLYEIFIISQR